MDGPVHQVVTTDGSRQPIEDLALGATEDVEDGIMTGASEGVLTVGGETPLHDALLLVGTAWIG